MLEELAKQDKQWQSFALKICGDVDLARDLVQDMYLRLAHYEIFNNRLVYKTLQNLFLDYIRQEKRAHLVSIEDFYYLPDLEVNNAEQLKNLQESLKRLKWFDREVLKLTHDNSLRVCGELTGVHYGVLNYHKTKALKKLKKIYNGSTKR